MRNGMRSTRSRSKWSCPTLHRFDGRVSALCIYTLLSIGCLLARVRSTTISYNAGPLWRATMRREYHRHHLLGFIHTHKVIHVNNC